MFYIPLQVFYRYLNGQEKIIFIHFSVRKTADPHSTFWYHFLMALRKQNPVYKLQVPDVLHLLQQSRKINIRKKIKNNEHRSVSMQNNYGTVDF